ncbi:MAG: co-chaperone GroES [Candidatus Nitrotoga sp.]
MKVRPLSDRIIVKRVEEERKTASGIVIPDSATEKPDQGEIIAVGKGKIGDDGKLQPMNVKVGDKVLFGQYAGQAFKIDGQDYMTMREDDIIGVIEK